MHDKVCCFSRVVHESAFASMAKTRDPQKIPLLSPPAAGHRPAPPGTAKHRRTQGASKNCRRAGAVRRHDGTQVVGTLVNRASKTGAVLRTEKGVARSEGRLSAFTCCDPDLVPQNDPRFGDISKNFQKTHTFCFWATAAAAAIVTAAAAAAAALGLGFRV